MVVAGSIAYVADRRSGLRVVNVANPAAPAEVGFYDRRVPHCVAVSGAHGVCRRRYSGLRVIDVADPAVAVEVGFYDTPGNAKDVAVAGKTRLRRR